MKTYVCITVMVLVALICSAANAAIPVDERPQITVTGEARVNVVPDVILVNLGTVSGGDTPEEAREANHQAVNKIMDAAVALKIDKRNIRTEFVEIDCVKPNYRDYGGWSVLEDTKEKKRYGARQMVLFTLNDTTKLEDLFAKTLEAGATRIFGVNFKTSQLRKYRDQARALAIKAAKEKAVALAKELGSNVGKPLKIQEHGWYGGNDWQYYGGWRWWTGGNDSSYNSQVSVPSNGGNDTDGIALGEIGITGRVTVTFELL